MSKIKNILMKVLGPFILSQSKVVSNERLSPHFQFLTIKGKSLKKAKWIPGQKIQVQLKNDQMRSYTPSSWDSNTGIMQTLIYMHGKGPGAVWARDVKEQSKVTVLGPRASLKLDEEVKTVLFFGDETTFGLAHALKKYTQNIQFHFFFEATDLEESLMILKKFELADSVLAPLNELNKIRQEMGKFYSSDGFTKVVLSGKQQSIVALREMLYEDKFHKESISTKVYWGWKDDPNGKLKHK